MVITGPLSTKYSQTPPNQLLIPDNAMRMEGSYHEVVTVFSEVLQMGLTIYCQLGLQSLSEVKDWRS